MEVQGEGKRRSWRKKGSVSLERKGWMRWSVYEKKKEEGVRFTKKIKEVKESYKLEFSMRSTFIYWKLRYIIILKTSFFIYIFSIIVSIHFFFV
ncbi:unnamed protein product [Blepharisma stoltei]|uniref:Uncharacterized protein n=1 Tax=Blepharisma stoltei TaxID=1481888 RepID=A0AAU9IV01_9CILI|nr:unnamed protein product [Blepharisma stoltei]